jgi:hypothetical protein
MRASFNFSELRNRHRSDGLSTRNQQEFTMSTSKVIGVFDNHWAAEEAVRRLQRGGFDMRQLSIVGKGYHTNEQVIGFYTRGERLKTWGGIGAFWGGMWGLLVGAAFIWVPGVGPLAVAGPLAQVLFSTLQGAAIVGGAGLIAGALSSIGVPNDEALKYQTDVAADRFLLVSHGNVEQVSHARELLRDVRRVRDSQPAMV